ncbi:MAG: hypothetical protein MJK10_10720 [Pseudomonadales bacterium]|nr:hypothetical protein [Pseudomonadales bacterium]NRA15932.1 hypothetical protein [Oceanospirillaceae bacterium]
MQQPIELFATELISISLPKTPLNCQLDGGHLVVEPRRHISDRIDCSEREAIELMAASMLAAKAMYSVLKVEKVNYQEMGNWSLDASQTAKLHIHIFGRHKQQRYQQRGESIRFFPSGHNIYTDVYRTHSPTQISDLISAMQLTVKQSPFTQLFSI